MFVFQVSVFFYTIHSLAAGDAAFDRDGRVLSSREVGSVASLQAIVEQQTAEMQTLHALLTSLQTHISTMESNNDAFQARMENDHDALKSQLAQMSTPLVFTGEGGSSRAYADGATIHFDRVLVNVGLMYDSRSGVVRIPQDGVYIIYFRTDPPAGIDDHQSFDLKVNNNHQINAYGEHGHLGSALVSLHLHSGDQVMVTKRSGANDVGYAAVLSVVRVSV